MALTAPQCLAVIQPYLTRAAEAEAQGPGTVQFAKLAFYLRYAAADMGVKALERVPAQEKGAAGAFLGDLLTRLEQDRATHGIRREDEAADLAMVEKFALTMFGMADRADRAGMANKDTVRNYMAAGPFFDAVKTLSQGACSPKLEELSKYSKIRCTAIVKDLKAGKVPAPPEGPAMDFDAELAALGMGDVGMSGGGGFSAAFPQAPAGGAASSAAGPFSGAGAGGGGGFPVAQAVQGPTAPYGAVMPVALPPGPGAYAPASSSSSSSSSSAASAYEYKMSEDPHVPVPTASSATMPGPGFPSAYPGSMGGGFGGGGGGMMSAESAPVSRAGSGAPAPSSSGGVGGGVSRSSSTGAAAPLPPPSAVPGAAAAALSKAGLGPGGPGGPGGSGGYVGDAVLSDAAEYARFAIAALKERNAERAFMFLANAINTLQPGALR